MDPPAAGDFQIAVICALERESNAVLAVFDEFWEAESIIYQHANADTNSYTTGRIGNYNVVLAHMPQYGKTSASNVASNFRHSFPNIKTGFVVGVCGAVPRYDSNEIWLGDVIISTGIVEYDMGRRYPNEFVPKDPLGDTTNIELKGVLHRMKLKFERNILEDKTAGYLAAPSKIIRDVKPKYPGIRDDKLYRTTHRHKHYEPAKCNACAKCETDNHPVCSDATQLSCVKLNCHELEERSRHKQAEEGTTQPDETPHIHFGLIASGDTVMKSGQDRNDWAEKLNVIGFEMEGAGVWKVIPCFVIKGVCDYADSHKNKGWQDYAAATAAACMKAFLGRWRPSVSQLQEVEMPGKSDPKFLTMLQDLFVNDPPATRNEIEAEKGGLLPGTGSWIFESPPAQDEDGKSDAQDSGQAYAAFSEWWTDLDAQVLWIRGDPGKGKTMLAISLIDEIQRRLADQQQHSSALAYFFCIHTDQKKNHATYILRSLLWQLFSTRPKLSIPFRQKYDKQGKEQLLTTSTAALHSLLDAFGSTFNDSALPIFLVVDALDECSEDSRTILLDYLKSKAKAKNNQSTVKWLITVRNDVELYLGARTITLEDNSSYVNRTLDRYIIDRVEALALVKSYDGELRAAVATALCEKADGTFLWVALVWKELQKPKVKALNTLRVLRDLPSGLVPLYRRILNQLLDNDEFPDLVADAVSVLQTLLVAFRPLSFKELAVAADLPENYHQKEADVRDCVLLCGSFLHIQQGTNRVSLVHQSVKDYLAPKHCSCPKECRDKKMFCRNPDVCRCAKRCLTPNSYPSEDAYPDFIEPEQHFPVKESEIHTTLAKRALEYLNSKTFSQGHDKSTPSWARPHFLDSVAKRLPLTTYAVIFWVLHTRNASLDIRDTLSDIATAQAFLTDWLNCFDKLRGYEQIAIDRRVPSHFNSAVPLHAAAYTGIPLLVELLLDTGANVDVKDSWSHTALYYAAGGGHRPVVQLLLDNHADINAKEGYGIAPLTAAARNGHESVVRLLLDNHADVHTRDKFGTEPLYEAVDKIHEAVAKLLIERGAKVEAATDRGRTPLHVAAAGGHRAMSDLLVRKTGGCGVVSGVFMADESPPLKAARAKDRSYESILVLLISHATNLSPSDERGYSPLHYAVDAGYEVAFHLLVNAGASVNAADDGGWTPLQWTVEKGFVNMARLLLDKHADPDQLDKFGRSTLHWAASEGRRAIAELLLDRGANPNLFDTYSGATALHAAVYRHNKAVTRLLLENGADPNARLLHPEVKSTRDPYAEHTTICQLSILLEKHSEELRTEAPAGAPLHWADEDTAAILLDHGADPNVKEARYGVTKLALVASSEYRQEVLKLLLDRGADPNVTDIHGGTALHYAPKVAIAEQLLAKGADVNHADNKGVTALHLAARFHDKDLLHLLLTKDANPNLKDSAGMTPLQRLELSYREREKYDDHPEHENELAISVQEMREELASAMNEHDQSQGGAPAE